VEDTTVSLDVIISSARRGKAADVQAWIDEFHPEPIEVLRRIASVSPPHQRILTLISDELARFPPANLPEPILDLADDAVDQISDISQRLRDLTKETEDLENEEKLLNTQLMRAKERQAEAKREYERYCHLIGVSSFGLREEERLEERRQESEMEIAKITDTPTETARYNELWGENRHLRNEIGKLQAKIDEQREYHREYALRKAMAVVQSRLDPRDAEDLG
jgi:cell shape-determining protein MreC